MLPSKNKDAPVSSALAEAQAIIEAAEEKAKKIIDESILSAEEIKETGYREGLRLGKETITKTSIKIIKEHEALRQNIENEAAKLCYQILEHIFSLQNPEIIDPIRELAKKLLRTLPIGGSIELQYHPSHRQSLLSIEQELRLLSKHTTLQFVASEEIDQSTLLVKTDFGDIKVSLRDFFSEIAKQMKLPSGG